MAGYETCVVGGVKATKCVWWEIPLKFPRCNERIGNHHFYPTNCVVVGKTSVERSLVAGAGRHVVDCQLLNCSISWGASNRLMVKCVQSTLYTTKRHKHFNARCI